MTLKVLVICAANLNRSPTVAAFLRKKHPDWEVRDAGFFFGYPYQVNQELVNWADRIYVMEREHATRLTYRYGRTRNVAVLGILDEYDRFSPELYAECERIFKD